MLSGYKFIVELLVNLFYYFYLRPRLVSWKLKKFEGRLFLVQRHENRLGLYRYKIFR